ncbi:hypothetical protein Phi4:1_gp082 [Cellulophaga phage phi4:1]|uniref:Uncharacterized protein n=3 Tax=Lightbulbvirus Cba41 TaxID=1918524 RepID=A0A0S2MWI3_9CAUD|nr:hypothetical protein Phi4:1_gp082 [Cellulophaga phage phi4:1]AGO49495.1 hypothetical protein Phi4:1_gp082 [Cellulophaga phage phi4:1]ALO80091.1 hypothetical protein Phi4113_082 [Cellulophaga phage phi4:1_13]ALO80288.1 hypothetical protein Phi4118_082 [Cellulophaga phage phi4:1_18]
MEQRNNYLVWGHYYKREITSLEYYCDVVGEYWYEDENTSNWVYILERLWDKTEEEVKAFCNKYKTETIWYEII